MDHWPLENEMLLGQAARLEAPSPLGDNGRWYTGVALLKDGLEYRFAPGALTGASFLTADFLLPGSLLAVFLVQLQEGEDGPVFGFSFGLLNQCQARLRLPLEAANLNRWMYPREGALLKPLTLGERVDLARVDRVRMVLHRTSGEPVRWCMTPLTAAKTEPPLLQDPLLPEGPLLDELGQSRLHQWPGKTLSVDELCSRLNAQQAEAGRMNWPSDFSRWGGWANRQLAASGFFRTAFEEGRWWLVDPDGHPFWSNGPDCVSLNPESAYSGIAAALSWLPEADGPYGPAHEEGHWGQSAFNYLVANFMRCFGAQWYERWANITLGLLRDWGFNTVANWSDWKVAAKAGFPYVRPLTTAITRSPAVYRDFPDVFHPGFEADAEEYAQQLAETANDPALIGYFMMNEPTWGFASDLLAEGMLFNTPHCASRQALVEFLRERYPSDADLSTAWEMDVRLDAVAAGSWQDRLTPAARNDLEAFSTIMVEKFFGTLSAACKKVDPNHLNLGARYYTIPPEWVARGMVGFDVFSINCYRQQVPAEDLRRIHDLIGLPTMIGEWHFGALDAGLPANGIGSVRDQHARGQAYRAYVEKAAAIPWCVGVHYFTLYDQSALGRFDGENYNIGFLDICNRPYQPLVDAARLTNSQIYSLAAGEVEPTEDAPEYLPLLFL